LLVNYEWDLPMIPEGHQYPKKLHNYYCIGGGNDEYFKAIGVDIFGFEWAYENKSFWVY